MKWHRAACGEPLPRCGKDWFRGLPKRDSRRNGAIERATHRDEKSVCKCPVQAHGSESCTAAATDSDEPLVQRSGGLFRTSHLNHGQKIGNKRRGQRQISIGIHRDGHGFQVTFCQAKEGMQSTLRFIGHRNDTSHDLSKLRFSAPVQELENMRRILAAARESINQLDQAGRMRSTPFTCASCLIFHFPHPLWNVPALSFALFTCRRRGLPAASPRPLASCPLLQLAPSIPCQALRVHGTLADGDIGAPAAHSDGPADASRLHRTKTPA